MAFPEPKIETIEGNTFSLKCRAHGQPRPKITWTKEGESLERSSRVHTSSSGDLQILSVLSSDHGVYRCRASNNAGSVVAAARVVVKGQYVCGAKVSQVCAVYRLVRGRKRGGGGANV